MCPIGRWRRRRAAALECVREAPRGARRSSKPRSSSMACVPSCSSVWPLDCTRCQSRSGGNAQTAHSRPSVTHWHAYSGAKSAEGAASAQAAHLGAGLSGASAAGLPGCADSEQAASRFPGPADVEGWECAQARAISQHVPAQRRRSALGLESSLADSSNAGEGVGSGGWVVMVKLGGGTPVPGRSTRQQTRKQHRFRRCRPTVGGIPCPHRHLAPVCYSREFREKVMEPAFSVRQCVGRCWRCQVQWAPSVLCKWAAAVET